VLEWIASRRGNVAEALKWRDEIPSLMCEVAGAAA
jgi:hypothetical protein